MKRPPLTQLVTFLYTRDLEETAAFYENILGLEMVLDQGGCRIYRITSTAFVGFCREGAATGKADHPEGVIVTLVSDQVDEWHTFLQQHEVAIEKPPTRYEKFNIYHLFVRDPNGYLVEIQQFLDPEWPQP